MQTFQDSVCSVEASHEPGCVLSLRIHINPEATQKAEKKAVKIVNKQISIPGFRKGHAPNETVMERYRSYVESEWKELIVDEAYRHALELTKIYPMDRESIQKPRIETCSVEKGALVLLKYTHYPLVPELNFTDLTRPTVARAPVSQEEIENEIETTRGYYVSWEIVDNRPVEVGDYVVLSIDLPEGESVRNVYSKELFLLEDRGPMAWITQRLLGHMPPCEVEGMSEVSADASEEDKQLFTPQFVRFTVAGIKKKVLPEIDDALAQRVGCDSLEAWRAQIRAHLENKAEAEQHVEEVLAIEKELLQRYPFDIPTALIEKEAHSKEEKGESEMSEEEARQAAEQRLRRYFLQQKIIQQRGLSVSQEETQEELSRYVQRHPYLFTEKTSNDRWKILYQRIHNNLLHDKIRAMLLKDVGIA